MKLIAIAAACMLLPRLAIGACETVEQVSYQPSSPRIRITALVDGKMEGGTRVDVFPSPLGPPAQVSITADDDGIAAIPPLAPGYYEITATSKRGLRASLFVIVSSDRRKTPSAFSMNLKPDKFFPRLQDKLEAARTRPSSERIQDFAGVVRDPTGGGVPGARIRVWKKRLQDEALPVEIRSDSVGRFSTHLAEGTYIALFQSGGFLPEVLVFDVVRGEGLKDLRVSMEVWSC
jgi:hypothetical protein